MSTKLLPCPFCGGEAELHPSYDMETDSVDGWFAWCNNKECECVPETREHFTEAEAIAAWNTRAERTCRNLANHKGCKEFVCSECGVHYLGFSFNYCPGCGAKAVDE